MPTCPIGSDDVQVGTIFFLVSADAERDFGGPDCGGDDWRSGWDAARVAGGTNRSNRVDSGSVMLGKLFIIALRNLRRQRQGVRFSPRSVSRSQCSSIPFS